MGVRAKSIYDEAARTDGYRVLATRYWPRGVSRDRVDAYTSVLAPSRDLLRAFKDGRVAWSEFRMRYMREMKDDRSRAEIARLAELAAARLVTVMCTCRDDAMCHRRLLKGLIERSTPGGKRR